MRSRGQTSIVINLVAFTMTHNNLSFCDREKGGAKEIINKKHGLHGGRRECNLYPEKIGLTLKHPH